MSAAHLPAGTEPRQCLPPLAPARRTALRLPEGSCDALAHVFASACPLDPARGYTPAMVTVADYRRVMEAYGIDRAVLVQPSVYGFDNSALLSALTDNLGTLRIVDEAYRWRRPA
ncbi:MAG: hypothetical protein EOS65_21645 [Mesorhizobium sp.]|uniref:hypothetical protein n=1 Tax=Mesorhizobium sp. TaxID=1871066 RepID=UPI000FD20155|nr:hypothetical protein [Mesorhizobium sp.]RVC59175.1 hypothetical protein EN779_16875 [Mesorhizobium sp. M4B.F.Ca.ET.088.02.2.1]RWF26491.1 MAG: hypothetical protein EOS45_28800 [Mesorhizobium sp.]RWF38883.1 MAG: hypothetical protein EOS65_21645 [Mesorhizobium sp.]TIX10026.1 MAG: hypothetical protein E5V41_30175 [Mesorhizobium sp.]TIX37669.1 MAG: hypothetical protein E5V40_21605 [Mesorhizobium sp.]